MPHNLRFVPLWDLKCSDHPIFINFPRFRQENIFSSAQSIFGAKLILLQRAVVG